MEGKGVAVDDDVEDAVEAERPKRGRPSRNSGNSQGDMNSGNSQNEMNSGNSDRNSGNGRSDMNAGNSQESQGEPAKKALQPQTKGSFTELRG